MDGWWSMRGPRITASNFAIDLSNILSLPPLLGTSKRQNTLEEHLSATLNEACKEMRLSCSRRRNKRRRMRTLKAPVFVLA